MTVYVDDMKAPFGRMVMCHMWADTLPELLAMVDAIGVARRWIQGHPTLSISKARNASWVHFDISLGKKDQAIRRGAVLTDRYGPVEHVARLKGDAATLESVAACRALAAGGGERGYAERSRRQGKTLAATQMDLLSAKEILRDDLAGGTS